LLHSDRSEPVGKYHEKILDPLLAGNDILLGGKGVDRLVGGASVTIWTDLDASDIWVNAVPII
jgi:hypothetical protein